MLRCVVPDVVCNQDLLTLPLTATVEEAAKSMAARRVRSVLVVDEEPKLVGIFTGTDMIERVVACGKAVSATILADVMSRNPETIAPDRPAIEALRMMQEGGFRHLPVMQGNRLIGIISRRDFLREEEAELELEEALWEEM